MGDFLVGDFLIRSIVRGLFVTMVMVYDAVVVVVVCGAVVLMGVCSCSYIIFKIFCCIVVAGQSTMVVWQW